LTLGSSAVDAGSFTIQSSGDVTAAVTLASPAIVAGITGLSLTASTGAGSSVWPVLVFTPVTQLAIGDFITITMPQGYFIGTATFAAAAASPTTAMTGSATAVTATSTQIVITTAGAVSGTAALTITLSGLTLGSAMAASYFTVATSQKTATFSIVAPALVAGPTFTSITWTGNAAGYATDVVLVFTPGVSVSTTITLGMPAGYFTGTGTFAATKCSVATMTGTTTSAAVAETASLVITISVVATGTSAVTMTLTGLSLGTARGAGYFALSTAGEAGTVQKAAPAIGSVVTSASITLGSAVTGSDPKPVLVFTPVAEIPIGGFITITMPAGYFIGTATFAAGAASPPTTMTGSATAVTATSTQIVITTAVVVSGVAALTVTLSGLTLGSVRAVGSASSMALSTSKNIGMVYSVAPAILGGLVAPSVVLSSNLKAATGVTATVTFTTATAGIIKAVTVAGVNFLTTGTAVTAAITCTGLTVGVASVATTNLVMTVTTPGTTVIAAATVITCSFAGLTNAAAAAAASTVTITTATADANIDRATGVVFPAIFNALLVSPSIVLSSSVKAATGVIATVTFTTATVGLIAKITVAGVNFGTTITAALTCTGLSVGVASISTTNLVLTVTTPASIAAATVITCNFAGLTNAAAVAAASTATITTATASAELDGVYVSFPAITADVAAADNKKSSASLYGLSVLLIALPFLFA
jgi:hypothetical protein